MYRTLKVNLNKDFSVDYEFSRSGFKDKISEFLIEFPSEKVVVNNIDKLQTDNFNMMINNNNYLHLTWDKHNSSNNWRDNRIINYSKKNFMSLYQENPPIYRYQEIFKIKAKYDKGFITKDSIVHMLYVHGLNRQLSVLKKQSKSIFTSYSYGKTHTCGLKRGCSEHVVEQGDCLSLRPSELIGIKFYCSGVLDIDWFLEL